MGGSSYSDDFYRDRVADRAARGVPTFSHDHDIKTGVAPMAVHDALNIRGKIRESRDSEAHPESVPIAVILDVTGSMARVPKIVQGKIPQLMGLLLRKGYVKDPQVLFGAVGDFFADRVPLQIGQFESGIEMDDDITKVVLEGGGGGQQTESYQDALYFFAHRVKTDAWEKRGKKGYLFLIGDERPFSKATKAELERLIGDGAPADVSTEDIVRAAQEKWHVFFFIVSGTSYATQAWLKETWTKLLDAEHVIAIDSADIICETIGTTIGLCEGAVTGDTIGSDLADTGATAATIASTKRAVDSLARSTALAPVGTGELPEKSGRSTAVERL